MYTIYNTFTKNTNCTFSACGERENCWYARGICTNRHRYHLCTLTYVDYINKCHHYNVHTIPLIPKSNEKLKHTSQHSYIITFITLPHPIIHISHCDITNWSHRPLTDDITRRSLHTSFTNIQSHMHTRAYTHVHAHVCQCKRCGEQRLGQACVMHTCIHV